MNNPCPAELSDVALISEADRLASQARETTTALIRVLIEVEARQVHLALGYSSLFSYCTARLKLSEGSAYSRINAARLACRFPAVLDLLESGALTLAGLGRLSAHLSEDSAASLLGAARFKSTRDIEKLVAALHPKPTVSTTIRAVDGKRAAHATIPEAPLLDAGDHARVGVIAAEATSPTAPDPSTDQTLRRTVARSSSAPLGADRYLLRTTISREAHQKLERLQQLMRHRIPNGDVALIIDEALELLLARVERERCGKARHRSRITAEPKASVEFVRLRHSRHIPAAIRRAVWTRDKGQCAFAGPEGRCPETAFLEIHHLRPFADGGSTTLENLALRCRAHNAFESSLFFGDEWKSDGTLRAQS